MKTSCAYSNNEKRKIVEYINKEKSSGHSINHLAKKLGITYIQYYHWNKELQMNKIKENVTQENERLRSLIIKLLLNSELDNGINTDIYPEIKV
ncbi:MAG: hypothetical protein EKE20_14575 [Candidatus Symbiopectobacterium sp. Dall1.0]|nr:hypothetical protein [Candidatus Symbiopectobacterium sp. Dall1.0]